MGGWVVRLLLIYYYIFLLTSCLLFVVLLEDYKIIIVVEVVLYVTFKIHLYKQKEGEKFICWHIVDLSILDYDPHTRPF